MSVPRFVHKTLHSKSIVVSGERFDSLSFWEEVNSMNVAWPSVEVEYEEAHWGDIIVLFKHPNFEVLDSASNQFVASARQKGWWLDL